MKTAPHEARFFFAAAARIGRTRGGAGRNPDLSQFDTLSLHAGQRPDPVTGHGGFDLLHHVLFVSATLTMRRRSST